MKPFVKSNSVVRKIWGKGDTILFVFAGASAEFALNKAVDWLYFTGKLPSDPLGRLFSTVSYAREIVFSSLEDANRTIDRIRHIHSSVEQERGGSIPEWAYRDVLFMLIYYSIAAYELLEKKLSREDKEEVYNVFYRVGSRMNLKDLPSDYISWLPARELHLRNDLERSDYTTDLYKQYRKHLGTARFRLLIEAQKLVVPDRVKELLRYGKISWLLPMVPIYRFSRLVQLDWLIRNILLPNDYKGEIRQLDVYER